MSTFARNLGLECKLDKDKRGRTFAINNTGIFCKIAITHKGAKRKPKIV